MDAALPVLCLLLGIALPLLVIGFVVRRGVRQLAVASAYREVSGRLGLTADTRGVSLQGFVGHRRVWIGDVMVRFGRERYSEVRGVVALTRPLGLGLWLRRRGLSSRALRRRRVGPEVSTVERTVDRLFQVNGDDSSRVRALLQPAVVEALVALVDERPRVVVTDVDVRVTLGAAPTDPDALYRLVERMVRLAQALEEARLVVPAPDPAVGWVLPWRAVAGHTGLDFQESLPGFSGAVGARRVWATMAREPDGYRAVLSLWFGPHAPVGLVVRAAAGHDDAGHAVGQDIVVGDVAFDDAWIIKGWDPDEVRALMGPSARAALTSLGARGQVALDDRVLEVTNVDPGVIEDVLTDAHRLADAFGW